VALVWEEAAVAATETIPLQAALVAAVLALPNLGSVAHAETAPDRGYVGFKVLDYLDSQPGAERIRVKAPAITALVPINAEWSASGTLITDSISGASPAYHSSALTPMHDFRRAFDASLTRYLPQGTWSLGASHSKERDYLSRSLYGSATRSDESKNTVWNWGASYTDDLINPTNHIVTDETKRSVDLIAGVTQVVSANDIVQLNLGWSQSQGYLSDPYKVMDERPHSRIRQTLQTRWNHHLDDTDATLRGAYRYFQDNWGIRAHTFELEHVQPLAEDWKITGGLRYYTQNAARFYVNADGSNGPFAPSPPQGAAWYSMDQRLSGYGAVTLSAKLIYQIDRDTAIDLKYELYEQRAAWAMGAGSPNLLPFRARSVQWGLTHWF